MSHKIKQTTKTILIGVIVLSLTGLLYDILNGFHVLRNARSAYGIIAGLMLTGILAFAGEFFSELITERDKVADPLQKRALHLFVLLASVSIVCFLYWFIFHYFGIVNI